MYVPLAWRRESCVWAVLLPGSFSQCEKTFDFIFIQVTLIHSLAPSSPSVCIFSIEQASSLTQLWIRWKRLSIIAWSDYLVVRLLTHSHHYITEESLWNYSAIYHSLLYGPHTLKYWHTAITTRCLTRTAEILSATAYTQDHSYTNYYAHILTSTLQKYENQESGEGAGATWADLWVIIPHEYVYAYNELYKLLQIPSLGFRPRRRMTQHVASVFTKLTKSLCGHVVCPHPQGFATSSILDFTSGNDLPSTLQFKRRSKALKSLQKL